MSWHEGWSIPGSYTLAPEEGTNYVRVHQRLSCKSDWASLLPTFGDLGGRSLGVLATLQMGEGHLRVLGTAQGRGQAVML